MMLVQTCFSPTVRTYFATFRCGWGRDRKRVVHPPEETSRRDAIRGGMPSSSGRNSSCYFGSTISDMASPILCGDPDAWVAPFEVTVKTYSSPDCGLTA